MKNKLYLLVLGTLAFGVVSFCRMPTAEAGMDWKKRADKKTWNECKMFVKNTDDILKITLNAGICIFQTAEPVRSLYHDELGSIFNHKGVEVGWRNKYKGRTAVVVIPIVTRVERHVTIRDPFGLVIEVVTDVLSGSDLNAGESEELRIAELERDLKDAFNDINTLNIENDRLKSELEKLNARSHNGGGSSSDRDRAGGSGGSRDIDIDREIDSVGEDMDRDRESRLEGSNVSGI